MNASTLLGLAVLALGGLSAKFLWSEVKSGRLGRAWVIAEAIVLIAGLALGIAAVSHSRYPTPDTRLVGFPFLMAIFERSPTGGWADFVGFLTLPALIGNFAAGLLLPHIPFAAWAWSASKRRPVIQ